MREKDFWKHDALLLDGEVSYLLQCVLDLEGRPGDAERAVEILGEASAWAERHLNDRPALVGV